MKSKCLGSLTVFMILASILSHLATCSLKDQKNVVSTSNVDNIADTDYTDNTTIN